MDLTYQHSVEQWWLSLTAGIIYILIGALVLVFPTPSYSSLATLYIAGFGVVGILGIYYAVSNRKQLQHWGWTLMSGIIDLSITFLLLTTHEITMFILPIYVGFVLLFRSIIGVGFSTYLAHYKVRNWQIVLALSLVGILFSLLMIWNPSIGEFTLMIYTIIAFFAVGFAQVGIAYELKRYEQLYGKDAL